MAARDSIRSRRKGNNSRKKAAPMPARDRLKTPASSEPSKPRTATDVLRVLRRTRRSRSAKEFRLTPTQEVREMRDGVPATALHYIRKNLELIQSTAIVVAHALREQNVQLDDDAADVLRRHVSDELQDQIEGIDSLLGGVA